MDTNLSSYTRLPDQPAAAPHRRPVKAIAGIFLSILLLSSLVAFILNHGPRDAPNNVPKSQVLPETWMPPSRGVEQGVSEKAFREYSGMDPEYNWTNTMLAWQRTAFHFQPQKNWMNAPLFHMGWYHIWYQYNPDSAIWGNITWGPRGIIGLDTLAPPPHCHVQNLAYPANLSDPLLLDLVKYEGNPVIGAATWHWDEGLPGPDNGLGWPRWKMAGCYWVSSMCLRQVWMMRRRIFYALGTYDTINDKWTPDNSELDVGIGLRVDYGKYYASKTFYDYNKQRRILWGWIGETDSEYDDLMKGWASVQTIPRTVVFDVKTGTNILQWPVKEVEELRRNSTEFNGVELAPGSIIRRHWRGLLEVDVGYNCSTAGAGVRGALGPFGLIVLADHSLFELTPVYFYISKDISGGYKTFFCADEIRSSLAVEVNKKVHGGMVPVLDSEKLTMRLLVDHSIVESFAQGGRTVITSRIYPTKAVDGAARAFLFNNATGVSVTASLTVWEMKSAYIKPYPFDDM
ncbi:glycosyl hydrolases family 32 protein [Actinidia rufa]|uniref:beta-fructofuranosidase n=1 Tax=Actinidia rufa TaxID=165716 RepID=A0A7J0GWP8_9ERIC|nr:glycosyl hydrolases family 32 protein [Actinidia rufa]